MKSTAASPFGETRRLFLGGALSVVLSPIASHGQGLARPAPVLPAVRLNALIEETHGQSRVSDLGNFGQTGTAAVLQKLGHTVSAGSALKSHFKRDLRLDDLLEFDTVFSCSRYLGVNSSFSDAGCKMFSDYVLAGGWLVITVGGIRTADGSDVQFYEPLLRRFGVTLKPDPALTAFEVTLTNPNTNPLARNNVKTVGAGGMTPLAFAPSCKFATLGVHNNLPVIAEITHGKGKLIVMGCATILMNTYLAPPAPKDGGNPRLANMTNIQFLTNLIEWRRSAPRLSTIQR